MLFLFAVFCEIYIKFPPILGDRQQITNKFPIEKPFVVAGDSSSISYIQGVEETKPIILTQKALSHIKSKHLEDYQTLFDLTEGLENSWLSMDSKRYDTSKLIVLGDNFKSPYTSVCRIDSTIDGIAVNRINTFYKKENFLDLSISTYNLGKNIYCNKKNRSYRQIWRGLPIAHRNSGTSV